MSVFACVSAAVGSAASVSCEDFVLTPGVPSSNPCARPSAISFPRRLVLLDGDAVSAFFSAVVRSASTSSAILSESSFAFLSASDSGTNPASEPTSDELFFPNLDFTFALPDASLSSVDLESATCGTGIAARPSAS